MKVEGEYRFSGQPKQVWALLLDPDSLRACIPGVESLIETSPDHFDAVLRVGVAAIKGTYKGKVGIVDKQEPNSYKLGRRGQRGSWVRQGHRQDLTDRRWRRDEGHRRRRRPGCRDAGRRGEANAAGCGQAAHEPVFRVSACADGSFG